jgi:hypothetical protein
MVYTVDIRATPSANPNETRKGTLTTVAYDFVGTSVEGNREVEERTSRPGHYVEEMEHWRQLIQSYLEGSRQ